MPTTQATPQRLRVQPAPSPGLSNAVLCPICDKRMILSLLLSSHLNDHQHGLFGAKPTGQIKVEVTLMVEER